MITIKNDSRKKLYQFVYINGNSLEKGTCKNSNYKKTLEKIPKNNVKQKQKFILKMKFIVV